MNPYICMGFFVAGTVFGALIVSIEYKWLGPPK